ncbi:MAG TPA: endonuclease/exonuclease/phosphatase family protein, partial [Bacteroidales bacterium]|nr:endonuclease/exonuclease/phosphatase family protein [Bacteroidales bacterium]
MKKILYKVLLAINLFFALTLLISYMAVNISPETFAAPAFFGLAYPYLLLVNIILVIIWIALLRFEALISVIVIALGFNHFSNYIQLSKPRGDKKDTFKVLSYNVRLFNYFENKKGKNSEKQVFDFLKSSNADIICLQEFYISGDPDEATNRMKIALGGQYYSHIKLLKSGNNRYYGIATFSRFPMVRKGDIVHPGSSSLTIYTDVIIKRDTFRIYNNHLQSFRLKRMEKSFIEEITAPADNQALGEVRSLSVSLKNGFVRRAIQARVLKENIDRSPYPVIVLGDFNDTPVSYTYRKIRKGLHDSFVTSGYGAGFTYKGNYPPNRIDYILYDDDLSCSYFEI